MDVVTHRLRKTNVLYQQDRLAHGRAGGSLAHLGGYLAPDELGELDGQVDELLERLVHTASWLTDADRASLFLIDEDGDELWSKVAQGEHATEIRVRAGTGVVGWTVTHNQLANVEDAYADARFNREVDRRTGYRTSTILCTPVRDQNRRVLGALQIINKSIGVFTEEDESLARAVAALAALGIENINLFRTVLESHRRSTDLLDAATVCAEAGDRMALGTAIAELVAAILGCEQARLYYVDAAADAVWCATPAGDRSERLTLPIDDSLAGHAVSTGEAINVRDAYEDDRFDAAWERDRGFRVRNALCVPVRDRGGRLVAVLEAVNRLDGVFDEDVEEHARALAAQLGVARLLARG
jgi:adenylate cyclase